MNEITVDEMTIDEIRARMESDRAEIARRAEAKRGVAAQIVREAKQALEQAEKKAQELEEEAEALDGNVRPKRGSKAKPSVEATTETPAEPQPARKPRAKKAARKFHAVRLARPDGTVEPTAKLILTALANMPDGSGKGNKSDIQKIGDFIRAPLGDRIAEMLEAGTLKKVGKGKGAGTIYKAA